jgi:hypothetical protein
MARYPVTVGGHGMHASTKTGTRTDTSPETTTYRACNCFGDANCLNDWG